MLGVSILNILDVISNAFDGAEQLSVHIYV